MRLALMQVGCGPACLGGDGWMDSSDTPPPPDQGSPLQTSRVRRWAVNAGLCPNPGHHIPLEPLCGVQWSGGEAWPGWAGPGQDRKQRPELWDSDSPTSTSHPTTLILLLVLNHLPKNLQLHLSGSTSQLCSGFL